MKKKEYIIPSVTVVTVEEHLLLGDSITGNGTTDFSAAGDGSDDEEGQGNFSFSIWNDEEE